MSKNVTVRVTRKEFNQMLKAVNREKLKQAKLKRIAIAIKRAKIKKRRK